MSDLTDKRLGLLVVRGRSEEPAPVEGLYKGSAMWICECDCGRRVSLPEKYLRRSKKPSCGCWRMARQRENGVKMGIRNKGKVRQRQMSHFVADKIKTDERGMLEEGAKLTGVARTDTTCAQCGKVFDMYTKDWGWKTGWDSKPKYYCTYGCMRKAQAAQKRK